MIISKRKLAEYITQIKDDNRKEKIYADYTKPISEAQQALKAYSQGYEDGTDNMYNAICSKYKLKMKKH